jgi:hypothetical protein
VGRPVLDLGTLDLKETLRLLFLVSLVAHVVAAVIARTAQSKD